MTDVFLTILNMSLTASYVILFIILVRLPLKKAPKVISYALWSVAAFRLLCPFSFESILSLVPMNTSPIPQNIAYRQTPQINSGITALDSYVNHSLPAPTEMASADPLQTCAQIGSYIWLLGIAVMLVYSVVSVLILKSSLKSARRIEGNIYEAVNLKTPFVLGVFRPRIFIPAGLSAEEKRYIVRHEQTHIHRLDHIIKPFAFLVLSIHWFNPLVWIAFVLMSTDMELSCDERVLKEMGRDIKKAYSASLLSLATEKRIINGSPLAFGEGNVRGRIKNVLNYKKPSFWIVIVAVIAVICVGIGLMANPKTNAASENNYAKELYQYRTQYLGDNSKVINITDGLPVPKTLTCMQVQLYTDEAPYTVEVTYKTTPTVRESFSKAESQTVFDKNAVLMFALIGNADSVKFILNDGEQSLAIQRSRDWANKKMAKNVWDSSSTIEKFTALYAAISADDNFNEKNPSSNAFTLDNKKQSSEPEIWPADVSYDSKLSSLINSTEISIQPSSTNIAYCIVSVNNGYLSSDTAAGRKSIKIPLNSAASVTYALSDGKSTADFDSDEITIDFYNSNLKKYYTCQIIVGKSADDPDIYTLPAFPNWKSYSQA